MINVIASIKVKAEYKSEYIELFKANVPNVLAEKGCIEYTPTVDVPTGLEPQNLDDSMVTIIEKWESVDDLKAHLAAPHMLEFREKAKDMVEDFVLKILQEA